MPLHEVSARVAMPLKQFNTEPWRTTGLYWGSVPRCQPWGCRDLSEETAGLPSSTAAPPPGTAEPLSTSGEIDLRIAKDRTAVRGKKKKPQTKTTKKPGSNPEKTKIREGEPCYPSDRRQIWYNRLQARLQIVASHCLINGPHVLSLTPTEAAILTPPQKTLLQMPPLHSGNGCILAVSWHSDLPPFLNSFCTHGPISDRELQITISIPF